MRLVTFPPLLMWHWYLLAWLAGLWGVRFFVPSLGILAAVLFFHILSLLRSNIHQRVYSFRLVQFSGIAAIFIRLLLLFVFFAVGLTVGKASLPDRPFVLQDPQTLPSVVRNKQKVLVQGVVHEVIASPERRIKFILTDVKYALPDHEPQELRGNVVWTWANWQGGVRNQPDSDDKQLLLRPMVGETVLLTARIMPVVGFRNKSTWNSGEYWRERGVFWRMWTWGGRVVPSRSGAPSTLAVWREKLRSHVSYILAAERQQTSLAATWLNKLSKTAWNDAFHVIPALLFGDKYDFPGKRYEQLSRASLSHSFALSGMHLGIVALGVTFLFSLFVRRAEWYEVISRPKLLALGILPATAVYVWIGGASPSLVRAFVMCACWCLLLLLNRPKVFMDGLLIALALMTIWNPLVVFDLRLQLSALAIVALILILPFSKAIKQKIFAQPATSIGQKIFRGACDIFLLSTAIQLVLFPVVAWNFNEVSMWSVLNILWLPLLGMLIMPLLLLGLVVAWVGMLFPQGIGIAQELFALSATPVAFLFALLDDLERANLLVPNIMARPHWLTIAGWYGLLASCAVWWNVEGHVVIPAWFKRIAHALSVREKQYYRVLGLPLLGDSLQKSSTNDAGFQPAERNVIISGSERNRNDARSAQLFSKNKTLPILARLSICLFAGILLFPAVSKAYSVRFGAGGKTTMHVLDVGQGQAILLDFPNGKRLLLDGGGFSSRSFNAGKALIMPCITRQHDTQLRWVMATHPDTDHIRGLFYPLAYGDVGEYLATDADERGWNRKQLRTALKTSGLKKRVLAAGDVLTVSEGLELEVLHPAKNSSLEGNNKSLVLRLVKCEGATRVGLALLTGDIEMEGITALLASGADISARVLILPHHGSGSSFSEQLYDAVAPEIAIASCGYLNKYNFPAQHVRTALENKGVSVVSTAMQGEIEMVLD